jgi:hypothetical protein
MAIASDAPNVSTSHGWTDGRWGTERARTFATLPAAGTARIVGHWRWGRPTLLDDVCQLVRQQSSPSVRVGGIVTSVEDDIASDRVGDRPNSSRRCGASLIGVYPNVTEPVPKSRFEEGSYVWSKWSSRRTQHIVNDGWRCVRSRHDGATLNTDPLILTFFASPARAWHSSARADPSQPERRAHHGGRNRFGLALQCVVRSTHTQLSPNRQGACGSQTEGHRIDEQASSWRRRRAVGWIGVRSHVRADRTGTSEAHLTGSDAESRAGLVSTGSSVNSSDSTAGRIIRARRSRDRRAHRDTPSSPPGRGQPGCGRSTCAADGRASWRLAPSCCSSPHRKA